MLNVNIWDVVFVSENIDVFSYYFDKYFIFNINVMILIYNNGGKYTIFAIFIK